MPLKPGTRLGAYEILALAGGMGEVYRARDPRLERDVAIRILDDLIKEAVEPVHIAEVCTAMGRSEQALDYLELTFERQSPHLLTVLSDEAFHSLRSHPRFRRLIKGIGLAARDNPQTPNVVPRGRA